MGRKEKRTELKKYKRNRQVRNQNEEPGIQMKLATIIKLILVIAILLLVLYYILAVFVTKEIDVSGNNSNTSSQTTNSSSSVSNKILASNIFSQKEETYYVYFYDFSNSEDESIVSGVTELPLYKVDTESGLNSNYITQDAGNQSATSLEDLKVKGPTLLEISGDKIVGYYEGRSSITDALSE